MERRNDEKTDMRIKLRSLLEAGFAVDNKDGYSTPLQRACKKGYYEIAKILIENGADLNKKTYHWEQETYLNIAAENNQLDFIMLLLRYGANVEGIINKKCRYVSCPPLYTACEKGNLEAAQVLLMAGANPCAEKIKRKMKGDLDSYNLSILHIAIQKSTNYLTTFANTWHCYKDNSQLEIVRLLLRHGADVNAISRYDSEEGEDECGDKCEEYRYEETALDTAMTSEDPKKEEIIKLIKDAQKDDK